MTKSSFGFRFAPKASKSEVALFAGIVSSGNRVAMEIIASFTALKLHFWVQAIF